MGIDIRWENETGKLSEEIPDPKIFLGLVLDFLPLDKTVCLRFIDLYGDTVFNQQQIPVLINELQDLLQLITPEGVVSLQEKLQARFQLHNLPSEVIENRVKGLSPVEISEHIRKILDLAHRSKGATHTYLKFYGD